MDKILCARTILMYRYHDDMRAGGGVVISDVTLTVRITSKYSVLSRNTRQFSHTKFERPAQVPPTPQPPPLNPPYVCAYVHSCVPI